jgi:hypothetical protein
MTIFFAYAPVGNNANAFKPKKNNNKKKGHKGKDKPDTLDPSVYPTLMALFGGVVRGCSKELRSWV